ncbi:MAG: hypothetical protein ACFFBV_16815, partial [Promethearchaeota archaeon]
MWADSIWVWACVSRNEDDLAFQLAQEGGELVDGGGLWIVLQNFLASSSLYGTLGKPSTPSTPSTERQ